MNDTVLLFDLGGVLIESDMFGELKRLMHSDAAPADLVERWLANPVARRFELGRCDADEFARGIVREFALGLAPEAFLAAFATWPRGFSAGALTLLAKLRDRFRIGCLSNSNPVHWHAALTEPFDFAYSSHLIGCIKPDPEAFRHVLAEQALEAAQVVYFDDAESNVETARRCGIDAHRTVGFEALCAALHDLRLVR